MSETLISVLVGLVIAVFGAWVSARCRHDMDLHQRRRKTDR